LSSPSRANVIEVDFAARRRVRPTGPVQADVRQARTAAALQTLGRSKGFLVFWRPPVRRHGGEYLGGRWDWGWTLFVWTSDAAVGPVLGDLVNTRGYVPQRLSREGFVSFLRRASDVGGLLLDGELDGDGQVIHAEPHQLIPRGDALSIFGR
jgi:hypothetical protein